MGTKQFLVEITVPDRLSVFPEEGDTEDKYQGEEGQKELKEFQERFANDVLNKIKSLLLAYIEENFEDYFIDNSDDVSVEDWTSFGDYGIKINIQIK